MTDRPVQLVVPMAGRGTRFADAGYAVPKPLLPIHGQPMFLVVLANLLAPAVGSVVLIAQKEWDLGGVVDDLRGRIPQRIDLVEIDYVTDGPAVTVDLARPLLDPQLPVATGNSDQYVDASLDDFYADLRDPTLAGSILTMEDDHPKWSYAAIDGDGHVTAVREKEVISPYATVGVYGFASAALMSRAFDEMRAADDRVNGELYVAPSYAYLVARGLKVATRNLGPVAQVMHGLGVPDDYEAFCASPVSRRAAEAVRSLVGGVATA